MDDWGDDFEEFFKESLNTLKGMVEQMLIGKKSGGNEDDNAFFKDKKQAPILFRTQSFVPKSRSWKDRHSESH